MLLIDIYRYIKRRADKRPVYLKNFVNQSHHHGTRTREPSVSIIIPTRDKVDLLRACVESIVEKTTYKNFEIVVVNNQSINPLTLKYLAELENRGVKILNYPQRFNYSAICNQAAVSSDSEFLCFLNNDTRVLDNSWLSNLVDHAILPEVGLVGSKLIDNQNRLQHLGIALGLGGIANHPFRGLGNDDPEVSAVSEACFSVGAVTFACVLVRADTFLKAGGLDEQFPRGLNDVEFGIRMDNTHILCGRSILHHSEASTRGQNRFSFISTSAIDTLKFLQRDIELSEKYFGTKT